MTSSEPSVTESWKRPWSLNEIISFSNNWSLAGDSGVCELLKRFSSELLNEVSQVGHNVAELQIESRQLNVVMENVSNDLCMLANDQFMENLVEEVDSSQHSSVVPDGTPTSKEDRNAHVVPLVARALKMGLAVLENQFEVVDVTRTGSISQTLIDNDLETQTLLSACDFPSNELIYQPKDPYENRHLPHLIGSSDFIDDDTLGIGYIDDIDEVPALTADSRSVSPSPNEHRDNLTSSSSDDEDPIDTKGSPVNHTDDSDEMFDVNSNIKPEIRPQPEPEEVPTGRPLSLTEQLNKQMKQRLSVSSKPSEKVATQIVESPPSINKFNQKVETAKTTVPDSSLFSSDEEDLFSIKKPEAPVPTSRASTSSALAPGASAPQGPPAKVNNGPSLIQAKSTAVMEDGSESEDDIFKTTKSPQPAIQKGAPVTAAPRRTRKSTSTTSETDDDLFGKAKPRAPPTKSTVLPSVSKTQNPAAPKKTLPLSKTIAFSSDDDDDDLFSVPTRKPAPTALPPRTVTAPSANKIVAPSEPKRPPKVEPAVTKKEESDDDLFPASPPKAKPPPKGASTVPPGGSSTKIESQADTDDDDDFFPSLLTKTKPSVPPQSLSKDAPARMLEDNKSKVPSKEVKAVAYDSDDDDDLFPPLLSKDRTSGQRTSDPLNHSTRSDGAAKNGPTIVPGLSRPSKGIEALSDDDDDLFPAPSAIQRPTLQPGLSSHGGGAGSTAPGGSRTKVESQAAKDDSDDDDLFPALSARSVPSVQRASPRGAVAPKGAPAGVHENADTEVEKEKASDLEEDLFTGLTPKKRTSLSPAATVPPHSSAVKDAPSAVHGNNQSARSTADPFSGEERPTSDTGPGVLPAKDPGPPLGADSPASEAASSPPMFQPAHSARKPPAGAVPLFGASSNILQELKDRNRSSRISMKQPLIDEDFEVVATVPSDSREQRSQSPQRAQASISPLAALCTPAGAAPARIGSPQQEQQISLDSPASLVNQLSNLTKSRVRVTARRRPTAKVPDTHKEHVVIEETPEEPPVSQEDTALPLVNDDIFANLPGPSKKTKAKKKETSRSKKAGQPIAVDVSEIDDIFAIPGGGTGKAGGGKKSKSKSAAVVASDPLGTL